MSSPIIHQTLDRLRSHLNADIAYIAELVDGDMIVRAHCGPNLPADLPDQITMPRELGFCHYMVRGDIPQIIHDSSENSITAALAARKEFSIGSYIGVPVNREDGSNYGTLCCIGHQPDTSLNERDLKTLSLFGEIVASQIDKELEDQRLTLERQERIDAVLSGSGFDIHYQPIMDLASGTLCGFEALSRFPGHPNPTPCQWFKDAAAIGRDIELELAAIDQALKILPHLPPSNYLSVNTSADCILSEGLQRIIQSVRPEQIALEITEHTQVENYDALIAQLRFLRDLGIRIAVDDTGAGYSSLAHVIQLQPDLIKLDMSLTRNVDSDRARRSLANAMVCFAQETNSQIIAEGIETMGEKHALEQLGIRYGQGYLFAKPAPMREALTITNQDDLALSA